jgi:hypothetical protein
MAPGQACGVGQPLPSALHAKLDSGTTQLTDSACGGQASDDRRDINAALLATAPRAGEKVPCPPGLPLLIVESISVPQIVGSCQTSTTSWPYDQALPDGASARLR